MTRVLMRQLCFLIVFIALLAPACRKEYSCEQCRCGSADLIAKAGPDQALPAGTPSTLLTADTTDAGLARVSSYAWTKNSGPATFQFSNSNQYQTAVDLLTDGIYQFVLTITDECNNRSTDTIQVTVGNSFGHAPVANAGPDQTDTLPVNLILLDGTGSSDPDNNIYGYSWAIVSGPAGATIADSLKSQAQLTNLSAGVYLVALTVTDSTGLFSKDTVRISIVNYSFNPLACDPVNRPEVNVPVTLLGALSVPRFEPAIVVSNDLVFFAGGNTNQFSSRVDIWNTRANTWNTAELSIPRMDVAGVTARERIFFAGGYGAGDSTSTRVDIYNINSKTWSIAELSHPGMFIITAVLGNKVFFIGGSRAINGNLLSASPVIDIFNLDNNTWTTYELDEGYVFSTATVSGNKLYIAGGNDRNGMSYTGVIVYDETTNSWYRGTSLTQPKSLHASLAHDNKIYWAGGFTTQTGTTCVVEIRDLQTNQTTFGNLTQPVAYLDAHVVNGRIVFLHNGYDYSFFFDIYDPADNIWIRALYEVPDRLELNFKSFMVNGKLYLLSASFTTDGRFAELWVMDL